MACRRWPEPRTGWRRCLRGAGAAALVLLAACTPGQRGSDPPLGATGALAAHGLPELGNPLAHDPAAIAAGAKLYAQRACVTCHGRQLAGAMCPSLVNDAWVYGADDTTLFFLLRDGSVRLRARGVPRGGHDGQGGDMPGFGHLFDDTELWQLLSYIRSRHAAGD